MNRLGTIPQTPEPLEVGDTFDGGQMGLCVVLAQLSLAEAIPELFRMQGEWVSVQAVEESLPDSWFKAPDWSETPVFIVRTAPTARRHAVNVIMRVEDSKKYRRVRNDLN
jgi:hypothetical protein